MIYCQKCKKEIRKIHSYTSLTLKNQGGEMSKCICGLDHTKPMPDVFKGAPIVFSSAHEKAVCHACGAFGPKDSPFFIDPSLHDEKCKYIKSLIIEKKEAK